MKKSRKIDKRKSPGENVWKKKGIEGGGLTIQKKRKE